MWRMLVLIGFLLIAALGAVWIAELPGEVTLRVADYEIQTSVAIAVAAGLAAIGAIIVVWSLLRFIFSLPDIAALFLRGRRRAKGFAAISRGLVAVGSGDARAATRHAAEAEKLIGVEPLTLLLKAQSAQLAGDRPAAETAFARMTETPETRVLGLRGLYVEARRRGDDAAAARHAEEAARLQPSMPWANEALIAHQIASRDWLGAAATLDRGASLGVVAKSEARRAKAALLAARALDLEETDPAGAKATALEALKNAPDLTPAAALAGRFLSASGDLRKAAKIIETAWRTAPHPDLAAVYAELRPGDSARDKLERIEKLAGMAIGHEESRVALARAAMAAREFARARDALAPLLSDRPSTRICLLMASIEEAEHGATGKVREWLARATRAPRDPAWIAEGVVAERWSPVSPVSGRIDAFSWGRPPELIAPGRPMMDDVTADLDEPQTAAAPTLVTPPPLSAPLAAAPEKPAPEPSSVAPQTSTMQAEAAPASRPEQSPANDDPVIAPALAATPEPAVAAIEKSATPMAAPARKSEVVFPVDRAPDDPGLEETTPAPEPKRRFRVFG